MPSLTQHADWRFFGQIAGLCCREAFAAHLASPWRKERVRLIQDALRPVEAVLASRPLYPSRAIANSRRLALDGRGVTFRSRDCRPNVHARCRTMTLAADEFVQVPAPDIEINLPGQHL